MNKSTVPQYIKDLIKEYPQIVSGRKNFKFYNDRIVKTLKLVKEYYKKTSN